MKKTAGVPIRQILNANPAFVRRDLGDLTDLEQSIKDNGLLVPILVRSDFLIIDGARRLVAMDRLGYTEIPVRATDDWFAVLEHARMTRILEKQKDLPVEVMKWDEALDLYTRILVPLYSPVLFKIRGVVRKGKINPIDKADRRPEGAVEIIGTTTARLRAASSIANHLKHIKKERPDRLAQAHEVMREGLVGNINEATIFGVNTSLLELRTKEDTLPPSRKRADKQLAVLRQATEMLMTVASQIEALGPLDASITVHEARPLFNEYRRAMKRGYVMRRELYALSGYNATEEREFDE